MAKLRTVICAMCGKPFEAAAPNAKNCPECRPLAAKLAWQRYAERHPPEPKDSIIEMGDTPEQRAICLSCTEPKCKGWCEKLKN